MPGAGDFMIEVRREPGAMAGSIFANKIKDGEDGWEQHFKVEKIALGDFGATPRWWSTRWISSLHARAEAAAGLRERLARRSSAAIHEQWTKGKPWCHAHNSSRAAVSNISKRWNIKRPVVDDILTSWTARGIIEEDDLRRQKQAEGIPQNPRFVTPEVERK